MYNIISIFTIFAFISSGTGKSVTGAHIAYTLAMKLRGELGDPRREKKSDLNPCVMYCGPSQQSVNVVLGEDVVYHKL